MIPSSVQLYWFFIQAASAAAPSEGSGGGSGSDSSHAVMNDKVQALAGSVYEEFEKMISRYDRLVSL